MLSYKQCATLRIDRQRYIGLPYTLYMYRPNNRRPLTSYLSHACRYHYIYQLMTVLYGCDLSAWLSLNDWLIDWGQDYSDYCHASIRLRCVVLTSRPIGVGYKDNTSQALAVTDTYRK